MGPPCRASGFAGRDLQIPPREGGQRGRAAGGEKGTSPRTRDLQALRRDDPDQGLLSEDPPPRPKSGEMTGGRGSCLVEKVPYHDRRALSSPTRETRYCLPLANAERGHLSFFRPPRWLPPSSLFPPGGRGGGGRGKRGRRPGERPGLASLVDVGAFAFEAPPSALFDGSYSGQVCCVKSTRFDREHGAQPRAAAAEVGGPRGGAVQRLALGLPHRTL